MDKTMGQNAAGNPARSANQKKSYSESDSKPKTANQGSTQQAPPKAAHVEPIRDDAMTQKHKQEKKQ